MTTKLDYESAAWGHVYPDQSIGVRERPLVILAPRSHMGGIYGPLIAAKCLNVVAVVDDYSQDATVYGIPRWRSAEFSQRAPSIPDLLVMDVSGSPYSNAIFSKLIEDAGVDRAEFVAVLAELDLPAVYQTPRVMRERTIARQSDWQSLRKRLADDRSRETLDAVLLLRLTYDRRHLRTSTTSAEDEYFSVNASDATFRLTANETICDAGAYIGDVIRKVIAATQGQFREVHAFEPDSTSFAKLESIHSCGFSGIKLHQAAVGDYTGTIQYLHTGTMGSHVDHAAGGAGTTGDTAITRIDDAMESATFIKMDLEGFETRALAGASRIIKSNRPRLAVTGYHYADDLLEIVKLLDDLAPGYRLRLRHHSNYYYDSIIYAD